MPRKGIKAVEFRTPRGAMRWEDFDPWFRGFLRDEVRLMDVRDPDQGNVYGRDVPVPDLTDRIGDNGQATDQRFLPMVASANKSSLQSVNPLTASDSGGGEAEIQIAAHTVTFGDFVVSYSAGVIPMLLNSTLYHVYADDPDYEGGAVSYSASTDPLNTVAAKHRYYLGKITTPAGGGGGTSGGWGGGGGGGGSQIP